MGLNCFGLSKKTKPPSKNSDLSSEPCTSGKSSEPSLASSVAHRALVCDDLRHVFERYDSNGDGKISSSELESMLGALGIESSTEEVESMMKVADLDGDGYISLEEFMSLNKTSTDPASYIEDLRSAFTVFDRDGNGLISAKELHQVLQGMGERTSLEDCRKMIKGIDQNGDGAVNFEEFMQMMAQSLN